MRPNCRRVERLGRERDVHAGPLLLVAAFFAVLVSWQLLRDAPPASTASRAAQPGQAQPTPSSETQAKRSPRR